MMKSTRVQNEKKSLSQKKNIFVIAMQKKTVEGFLYFFVLKLLNRKQTQKIVQFFFYIPYLFPKKKIDGQLFFFLNSSFWGPISYILTRPSQYSCMIQRPVQFPS